jgi:DnaJ-class molecular chaperone
MTVYLVAASTGLQLKATVGDAEIYRRTPLGYVGQTRCPKCHGRGTAGNSLCGNCGGTGRQVHR